MLHILSARSQAKDLKRRTSEQMRKVIAVSFWTYLS